MSVCCENLLFLFVLFCVVSSTYAAWTYSYDSSSKTLTVSGSGAMDDYSRAEDSPWYDKRGEIKKVVIGSGITHIGAVAFYRSTSLTSVSLASTVTSIGSGSFSDCTSLSTISFTYITEIQGSAFRTCTNFVCPTITAKITYIGDNAFSGCQKTTAFSIASGNANYKVENGVLYSKDGKKLVQFPAGKTGSFTIPSTVTNLAWGVFENSLISSVTIGSGVTNIPMCGFYGARNLKTITFSSSVKSIESSAFAGCTSLTSITFPSSLQTIGDSAFASSNLTYISYSGTSALSCSSSVFSGCPARVLCVPTSSSATSFCGITTNFCKSSTCGTIQQQHNICYEPVCKSGTWTMTKTSAAKTWEDNSNTCISYQCTTAGQKTKTRTTEAVNWEAKNNTCYTFVCTENGEKKKTKTSTATSWEAQSNTCYTYQCTESGEKKKTKTSTATSWEAQSNTCYTYQCTESGEQKKAMTSVGIEWENRTNICYTYNCTTSGQKKKTRTSTAVEWENQTTLCVQYICTDDGEAITQIPLEVIEWENQTTGCMEYVCSNESGLLSRNTCNNDTHVCIDDECVLAKSAGKGWSVVIGFNESTTNEVNMTELKDTLSLLCGIEADAMEFAVEYNDIGQVVSVIVLVDDENTAQKITSTVEDVTQNEVCEFGVLCQASGIKIKEIILIDFNEIDKSEHNFNINMIAMLLMMLLTTYIMI